MVLKRLTILCIGLILGTLLIASNAFCGTDDSGLQVFTLNGADMMGETADVGQEDTKIAQYSLNMFNSGNGLCSYAAPVKIGSDIAGVPDSICKEPFSGLWAYKLVSGSYADLYVFNNLIAKNVSNSSNGDLMVFSGLNKYYAFTGDKLFVTSNAWSTTAEVTLPATGVRGALWQNRFWFSNGYTIYYSAAQNYEDYTNSATAGGTTNIFGVYNIYKLVGTRYGLYIFTNAGIFLQSGPSKAWTIEKISDLPLYYNSITTYNDNIYFQSSSSINKIWVISGAQISVFCEIPSSYRVIAPGFPTLQFCNAGNLLIMGNSTYNAASGVYHIKNKSWTSSVEYNVLGHDLLFAKRTAAGTFAFYVLPVADQFQNTTDTPLAWAYKTSWVTLDGNAGNRKEIDRIEFDYLGGTSSVNLFWASGNGAVASWGTYLTSPTNTRISTYVWNNTTYTRNQSNKFYLYFQSVGAQTMTTNYILKQIRIYYRNIGNYKTNTLR